jgi:hypothetical protein
MGAKSKSHNFILPQKLHIMNNLNSHPSNIRNESLPGEPSWPSCNSLHHTQHVF